jgi:hypothetical protein
MNTRGMSLPELQWASSWKMCSCRTQKGAPFLDTRTRLREFGLGQYLALVNPRSRRRGFEGEDEFEFSCRLGGKLGYQGLSLIG